jgi:predicted MPP superfamily phosphohydrolase
MNSSGLKMFKLISLFVFVLLLPDSFAGKIVTPWRARKEIVKQGNSFAIWYNKDNGETVNSVELVGPYNSVSLTIDNNKEGSWYFDDYTEATYNCSLSVTVPNGTPIELYDLQVKTSAGSCISPSSVKVIQEYQSHYYICHFTDPHVAVSWFTTGNATAPIMQALTEIVDIIDPELFICTGDNIIGFTRSDEEPDKFSDRWDAFFDGNVADGLGGLHNSRVPIFITTGNNDYDKYKPNPDPQKMYKLTEWNDYCGMRVYGFAYDQMRLLAFDDYLVELDDHGGTGVAKDFPAQQRDVLEAYLDGAGAGQLRIVIQHTPNRVNQTFCNNNNVQLALAGHTHSDNETNIGNTPTLRLTTAYLCFAEYWSGNYTIPNSARSKMRIVEIEDNEVVSHESIYIMDYIHVMDGLDDGKFIYTEYDNPNNGTDTINSATVTNDMDYDFFGCKVRFVMAKGRYLIDNGTLQQVIENDSVSVYDVKVPVDGNSSVTVNIRPDITGVSWQNSEVMSFNNMLSVARSSKSVFLKVGYNVKAILSLQLFNVKGSLIKSFARSDLDPERNVINLNRGVSGGIYLIRCYIEVKDGKTGMAQMKVPL